MSSQNPKKDNFPCEMEKDMEKCDYETLKAKGQAMSGTKKRNSDEYLQRIGGARQAFGQCFIRTIESRWSSEIPIYENFFSKFPLNTKANGRRETWSRWKRIGGETRTFLGGAKKRIPEAIDWAFENDLLSPHESHCFKEIDSLLTNPEDTIENISWRESCLNQCDRIVSTLGHFIKINNGEFFYDPFNEMTLDVYSFQCVSIADECPDLDLQAMIEAFESSSQKFNRSRMAEVNIGCIELCNAMGKLGMLSPSLFDLDVAELSIRLVALAEGRASADEVFCDELTLGELKQNPFVIDLLLQHLKADGQWLLERFVAIAGNDTKNSYLKLEDIREYLLQLARERLSVAKQQQRAALMTTGEISLSPGKSNNL